MLIQWSYSSIINYYYSSAVKEWESICVPTYMWAITLTCFCKNLVLVTELWFRGTKHVTKNPETQKQKAKRKTEIVTKFD